MPCLKESILDLAEMHNIVAKRLEVLTHRHSTSDHFGDDDYGALKVLLLVAKQSICNKLQRKKLLAVLEAVQNSFSNHKDIMELCDVVRESFQQQEKQPRRRLADSHPAPEYPHYPG